VSLISLAVVTLTVAFSKNAEDAAEDTKTA
jgi:hypothetical protein